MAPAGGVITMFYADPSRTRYSRVIPRADTVSRCGTTTRLNTARRSRDRAAAAAADSEPRTFRRRISRKGDERIRRQDLGAARASAFRQTMMTENLTAEKATAAAARAR